MATTVLHSNFQVIKLRLTLSTFFIFSICLTGLIGQATYVPPKIPVKSCKALDDAVLAAASGKTKESINTIQQLIKQYPTWTLPRQELSRIFYKTSMKNEAITTLEGSIRIDTNSQLQQLYTLGRLYEETGDYNNAMSAYKSVSEKSRQQPALQQQARDSLEALEEKMKLFTVDYSISLKAMPAEINTIDHEELGRWTIDGRSLIFTRLINEQEDLYEAHFDSLGNLETVVEMPFNSTYNEGGHTISPDGKYLVFTSCGRHDGLGGCDLYLSVLKEGVWTKPINMGPMFNTPSWDSQPCFGLDGLSIYFTSTRPGGHGGSDIWMVRQLSPGRWSEATNVGPEINTSNNEASPFIHFDGRTMYFMRDGKEGLGGYDLYISHLGIDGHWKTPENMGRPINSGADEGALALHPDGKRAMITRTTPDQRNDLFEFELPDRFQSSPIQVLYVSVTDQETNLPVRAQLELFDINGNDTIRTSQWADEFGKITVTLDRNISYGLISSAEGYSMYSLNLPADTSSVRKRIIEMISLASAVDQPIVLQNVFFSTGSSTLLPSSGAELNLLYLTLLDHPAMKIEIRGHTDNVGEEEYNQQLSEDRAKSVLQFLIDRGIDAGRLFYKGFGETKPVASNDTESGRQLNRRTEFVIVNSE